MEFLASLLSHTHVCIVTHVRPDGDALGSQLALGRFLKHLGKKVTLINTDPAPENLSWLPGCDQILIYDGSLTQRQRVVQADALVFVDVNVRNRIGEDLARLVQSISGPSYLIDHHPQPEPGFTHLYTRDEASSTGELIFELIRAHDPAWMDRPTAKALYTAIMTDTGSFQFSNTTPQVHRYVADILEMGEISPAPIHNAIYSNRQLASLRLLARALDGLTLAHDGQIAYIALQARLIRDLQADTSDSLGLTNYALSVRGVKAALLFTEVAAGIKISFRSYGDVYVDTWARAFGGGGHKNASGAFIAKKKLEHVVRDVVAAAPKYLDLVLPEPEPTAPLSNDDQALLDLLRKKFQAQ